MKSPSATEQRPPRQEPVKALPPSPANVPMPLFLSDRCCLKDLSDTGIQALRDGLGIQNHGPLISSFCEIVIWDANPSPLAQFMPASEQPWAGVLCSFHWARHLVVKSSIAFHILSRTAGHNLLKVREFSHFEEWLILQINNLAI